jgi:hypothetical protein
VFGGGVVPKPIDITGEKYGEAEALRLACEARENAIKELNAQGAGYSDKHSKPKEVIDV